MARCQGEELPSDALYLDEDILLETSLALNRALNLIDRSIGLTDNTHVNKKGYPIDWRGLAMMMKFDQHDISHWETLPQGRAKAVITLWRKQAESPTIKNLLDFLRQLQVYGLLRDSNFIAAIVDDVGTHKDREQQRRRDEQLAEEKRLQIEVEEQERREQASRHGAPYKSIPLQVAKPDWFGDARNQLVVPDATTGKTTYFDAFICYAREDIKFVKRMLKALECSDEYNLKLCVDDRDFFVGGYKYTLTARIMEERCKRIVLVMSPDFVKTPMCEFQTEYALSLSPGSANKKLLPLMYRTCDTPAGLKHIAGLYYTRDELKEWFWPRLGGSLVAELQWSEEEDHQRTDWDKIKLTSESLCPASRNEILSSPNLKNEKSSSSSIPCPRGMVKSGSASSVSSSLSSSGSFAKFDDGKNSPSGSNISSASAYPISANIIHSSENKPVREERRHQVQLQQQGCSPVNLGSCPAKYGIERKGSDKVKTDPLNDSSDESDTKVQATVGAAEALGKNETSVKEPYLGREMDFIIGNNVQEEKTSLKDQQTSVKPDKKPKTFLKMFQKKKK